VTFLLIVDHAEEEGGGDQEGDDRDGQCHNFVNVDGVENVQVNSVPDNRG